MDPSPHVTGLLFAAGALVAWTSLSFFIRLALRGAPLLRTAAATSTCNALLVAALVFSSLPLSALVPSRGRTYFLIPAVGLLMIGLSRLTYYFAIRRVGPSRTIPIAASTPALTGTLAVVILGEPLTPRMLLGLGALIAGITAGVRPAPGAAAGGGGPARRERMLGYLSAGATAVNWSVSGVLLKVIALDLHPLAAAGEVIWTGALFAWAIALLFGPGAPFGPRASSGSGASGASAAPGGESAAIPPGSWKWIALAALAQTAAVPSYSNALARTLAVHVSSITALQPLFVIFLAHLFLKDAENVTPRLAFGAAMTVVGTVLILI